MFRFLLGPCGSDTFLSYLLETSAKVFQCTQIKCQFTGILDVLEEQIQKYHPETGEGDTPFKSFHERNSRSSYPWSDSATTGVIWILKRRPFPHTCWSRIYYTLWLEPSSYVCLSGERLWLLDKISYLAAGESYSKFLNAWNVQQAKGFFVLRMGW